MRAPPDSSDVDIASFFPSTIEENAVLNNSLGIISELRSQSSKLKQICSETKKKVNITIRVFWQNVQ